MGIVERHTKDEKFNFGTCLTELDTRLKMVEEAMAYLASVYSEKEPQAKEPKIELLDNRLILPPTI
jgi:hypothetical protein